MLNQEQVDKEIKSIEECFRIDEYLKGKNVNKKLFGNVFEIALRKTLRNLFNQYKFSYGIIIKNEKEKSHEMDIIVYNKELPLYDGKPPFISGEFAIVSPDCVKVVIQVKRYITSPKDFDSIKDNLDSAYLLNPNIKKYLVAGWHPSKKTLQAYKDQFRNKSIKYFTFWKDGTWNSINIEGFQEFFSNIDYDLNNN